MYCLLTYDSYVILVFCQFHQHLQTTSSESEDSLLSTSEDVTSSTATTTGCGQPSDDPCTSGADCCSGCKYIILLPQHIVHWLVFLQLWTFLLIPFLSYSNIHLHISLWVRTSGHLWLRGRWCGERWGEAIREEEESSFPSVYLRIISEEGGQVAMSWRGGLWFIKKRGESNVVCWSVWNKYVAMW